MSSFVANHKSSHESRIFDQLLFLEKLKHNEIGCEMGSSFINSNEFNSVLKEFKRKRQQERDQKKWEMFLEKRQQEEINKAVSRVKATFPINEYQQLDTENVMRERLDSVSNGMYCEHGTEYTSHWLEDNHVFLGKNFHNYEKNNNKCFISHDINESSLSIKSDCQSEALFYAKEDYPCKNQPNYTQETLYQHTNFQNQELVNDFLNVTEQNIVYCDNVKNVLDLSKNRLFQTGLIEMNDRKGESISLIERNPAELPSDEKTVKLTCESKVAAQPRKEENSSSLMRNIQMPLSQKVFNEIKDESTSNAKNCCINEPEENYCKNIATRIQNIPGVDTELRKVEDIRIKMAPILSNIRKVININSPLSADEDLERVKQRTLEFGARFKRNYLYRTNCQINTLKEMMPSPVLINKKSKIILTIQKLTAVHHAAIQALQVIEKQLQTISIFGKIQELLSSFYNCVYELTLMLKPFYGYLKTQVLDEVETHLIETIKLLSELKSEETFPMPNRGMKEKKSHLKSTIEPPPWMKKSAALARLKFGPPIRVRKRKSHQQQKNKVLEPKQSKDSINSEHLEGEKLAQKQDMIKPVNFMMSVKQRPGAELRRANCNPIKTEEPKTMIEIISREGTMIENFLTEFQKNEVIDPNEIDPKLCSAQTSLENNNKVEKIPVAEITEPRNIRLICIKSEDDQKKNVGVEINVPGEEKTSQADENIVHYDELIRYRCAFKKYKKNIPLYEKNTLNAVVSMSETFLEETITDISKEINKMKISDLLGIVDEVEACEPEPDLESSI